MNAPALHHVRRGEGPPLLLLHGLGSDLHVWDLVIDALAEQHDVLAVDLPGFGLSPPLAQDRGTAYALGGAVIEALDAVGWERPAVVGHSLGGLVALEVARRDRVTRAVVISPAGMATPTEHVRTKAQLRSARLAARMLGPLGPKLVRNPSVRGWSMRFSAASPRDLDPDWCEHAARVFGRAPGFENTLRSIGPREAAGFLPDVAVPVRVVWGTRDRLLPPRQAHRFVTRLPDAELVMLTGVGHTPPVEDPARTTRTILGFTGPDT